MSNKPKNILSPTYDEIHNACIQMADVINDTFYFDCVVGISRGGLLIAMLFSEWFNKPLKVVDYSSPKGKGNNINNHVNHFPEIDKNLSILIADDIFDSGCTMREVCDVYIKNENIVKSAVLYYKDLKKPSFTPNYYWCKIYEDTGWVKFPWEV